MTTVLAHIDFWRRGRVCRRGAILPSSGMVTASLLLAYAFAMHVTRAQLQAFEVTSTLLVLTPVLALGLCVDSSDVRLVGSGASRCISTAAHWTLRGLTGLQGLLMIATGTRVLVQDGLSANDELPMLLQVIVALAVCNLLIHAQRAAWQQDATRRPAPATHATDREDE